MKRSSLRIAGLVALVAVLAVTTVSASGGPAGGGWYSGQTVMNIGSAAGTVAATAYDSLSNNTFSKSWTVQPSAAVTWLAGDIDGIPQGFQGSAVISSDQPIKAIVNVTNRLNATGTYGIAGGTAAAQYGGVDSASIGSPLLFPLVKSDFGAKYDRLLHSECRTKRGHLPGHLPDGYQPNGSQSGRLPCLHVPSVCNRAKWPSLSRRTPAWLLVASGR